MNQTGGIGAASLLTKQRSLAAALCCAIATAYGCSPPAPGPTAAPKVPVTVGSVQVRDIPVELLGVGNVEPMARVMLKPQVEGQLVETHFVEGQDVHAGDLMLVIDRRPFEAELAAAQARLAKDQAEAEDAQRAADQMAEALKGHAMSQRDTDKAKADAEGARAQVQADIAAADAAKLRLEYCDIRAPIDGRAGSLMVKPGNVLEANKTELAEINQIAPIHVSFAVPEQNLGTIKTEQARAPLAVRVTIPGDSAAGGAITGSLTFIDNKVDMTTGTIRLKATFDNADRRLWPGQFVNVVLVVAVEKDALVAPAAALQPGQKGSFAFVVKSDGTVEQRTVTAGRTVGDQTVIREGLNAGETVVCDGQLRLTPGAKIEVVGDKPPQPEKAQGHSSADAPNPASNPA